MPRIRTQLAIQATPDLLARVKGAATARGQTITRLLIDWIEAGLAGDLPAPAAGPDLLARVESLEAAMALLQRPAPPEPATMGAGTLEIIGAAHLRPAATTAAPAVGAITTAELAQRTGTNRAAWNNWAAKSSPGDVRDHPQAGGWRLIGKVAAESGGPPRWLWEQA
jgi:hypothetical protein